MDDKKSGKIKAIDKLTVHKICSGQVILSLASAVKELVENSIDAGATNIEIKLKEYGSESIEVIDNGKGVKECDFQSLTLKHHTSKLEDFSDLEKVNTFGFRGEALSSLCALGKMTIVTCHETTTVATKLEYDHSGDIVKQSAIARQTGTTVLLENLFIALPVRRGEFCKNIRREFNKMVQLLTAYCLISTGKRIICTNQNLKGKKTSILTTNGEQNVKSLIACVFGNKQVSNLMDFEQKVPSQSDLDEFSLSTLPGENIFTLTGYLSSAVHGVGRSCSDRQFFFINGRPCDLPKVARIINEVYHEFNRQQYPFICLNIKLNEGCVDVNVTPDKRQILVPKEKLLLMIIKASVRTLYEQQPMLMKDFSTQSTKSQKLLSPDFRFISSSPNDVSTLNSNNKRTLEVSNYEDAEESPDFKSAKFMLDTKNSPPVLETTANSFQQSTTIDEDMPSLVSESVEDDGDSTISEYQETDSMNSLKDNEKNQISPHQLITTEILTKSTILSTSVPKSMRFNESKFIDKVKIQNYDSPQSSVLKNMSRFMNTKSKYQSSTCNIKNLRKKSIPISNSLKGLTDDDFDDFIEEYQSQLIMSQTEITKHYDGDCRVFESDVNIIDTNMMDTVSECDVQANKCKDIVVIDKHKYRNKKIISLPFSIEDLKEFFSKKVCVERKDEKLAYRKFRSAITAEDAEDELRKVIRKEMFIEMDIIGQFNLGFIITKLNEDLFIIDQHATDEIYNYETLQKNTVLETQQLLSPLALELPVTSEATLIENLSIFEANGFKFNILEDAPPSQKIYLVSVPVSRNWSFGKEDVEELIFMLSDNSGCMCRPSRVNQMFASRACRKSVMIGTALSQAAMKKLISHMAEINQPWNCPHGRPTMRHLFNMNLLHRP